MRRQLSSLSQKVKMIIKLKNNLVQKRNHHLNSLVHNNQVLNRIIENNNRNQIVILAIVVINLFKKTRVKLNNLVIKAVALRNVQVIKAHLIIAHKIQKKIKKLSQRPLIRMLAFNILFRITNILTKIIKRR